MSNDMVRGDAGPDDHRVNTTLPIRSASPLGRRLTRTTGVVAAGLMVAAITASSASAADGQILRENAPGAIRDNYIVVLNDKAAQPEDTIKALGREHKATIKHKYL